MTPRPKLYGKRQRSTLVQSFAKFNPHAANSTPLCDWVMRRGLPEGPRRTSPCSLREDADARARLARRHSHLSRRSSEPRRRSENWRPLPAAGAAGQTRCNPGECRSATTLISCRRVSIREWFSLRRNSLWHPSPILLRGSYLPRSQSNVKSESMFASYDYVVAVQTRVMQETCQTKRVLAFRDKRLGDALRANRRSGVPKTRTVRD